MTEFKPATTRPVLRFDKPMRERLRRAYEKAVNDNEAMFTFEDNEYVTNYAKYLLEYLDMKLK